VSFSAGMKSLRVSTSEAAAFPVEPLASVRGTVSRTRGSDGRHGNLVGGRGIDDGEWKKAPTGSKRRDVARDGDKGAPRTT
jgi:hypothetical protein